MPVARGVIELLRPGQRMTREQFLGRWEAMPEIKFAELIDGVVYMPSPQTSDHGVTESEVDAWLAVYRAYTPGCQSGSQSTWLMLQSAPQPDSYLWILPGCGGQSGIQGKYHIGAPELAAETCLSSASYDLGVKKTLYQKAGVREYVAFLVEEEEIRWHRLVKGRYQRCQADAMGIFRSAVFPGLWLDVPALWKHDLARVLRTLHRGLRSAEHKAFVRTLAARKA
jgi:Putative restriction endonuclease